MRRHMLFIFGLVVAGALSYQLLNGCGSSGGSSVTTTTMDDLLQYQIFPETSEKPSLTFYWGEQKQTIVPPDVTDTSSIYGGWEGTGSSMFIYGHEPATESEMVLSSSREPIYSYCRGTIVYATGESTNFFNQRVGVVVVRYGRKYAVKHAHVVDIPTNITAGTTVEKGTLLGYTEQYAENVGFWESELVYLKSTSECRALPIVFYLDPLSRQVFDDILVKLAETAWYYPLTAPTTESWCSYVGTHEFWSDSRKFGVRVDRTSRFDSVEQFCEAHGLAWIIKQ